MVDTPTSLAHPEDEMMKHMFSIDIYNCIKPRKILFRSIRVFELSAEASIRAFLLASNIFFISGQQQYVSAISLIYLRLYPLYRQE